MPTRLLSISITLFWVCMMCSLVVYHILPERRRTESTLVEAEVLASQWIDIQEWLWVKRGGTALGAMMFSITKLVDSKDAGKAADANAATGTPAMAKGYRVVENAEIVIPILLMEQHLRFKLTLDLGRDFNVSKFIAEAQVGSISVECTGLVVGGSQLLFRIAQGSPPPSYRLIRFKHPLSLLAATRSMVTRQLGLQVGQSYTFDVMDPIGGAAMGKATVSVAAHEPIEIDGAKVDAFRVETTLGNLTRRSWVTADGTTLRRELIQGIVLDRGTRSGILAAYPELWKPLAIPKIDAKEFMLNLRKMGRAGEASSGADASGSESGDSAIDALGMIGNLLGAGN